MWVPSCSLEDAQWRTSSRTSGGQSNCVELACVTDTVAVRDSKHPAGPALILKRKQWSGFLTVVKDNAQ